MRKLFQQFVINWLTSRKLLKAGDVAVVTVSIVPANESKKRKVSKRVSDLSVASLLPLSKSDWKKMRAALTPRYVGDRLPEVIDSLQKNNNRPVPVHTAFYEFRHFSCYSRPGMMVAGINTTFRQKKLPYRVKISDLNPATGMQETRTVQILVMPTEK